MPEASVYKHNAPIPGENQVDSTWECRGPKSEPKPLGMEGTAHYQFWLCVLTPDGCHVPAPTCRGLRKRRQRLLVLPVAHVTRRHPRSKQTSDSLIPPPTAYNYWSRPYAIELMVDRPRPATGWVAGAVQG